MAPMHSAKTESLLEIALPHEPIQARKTFTYWPLISTLANEYRLIDQGTRGGQLPCDCNSALIEDKLPQYALGVVKIQRFPLTPSLIRAGVDAKILNRAWAFTRTASRGTRPIALFLE